jgi:hypothetical protein
MRLADKAFTDRLDHRDAAGHCGFEGDDDALLTGLGEDFVTVNGDQRLVGGDHVLAVLDGLEHQFASDGVAADQLDDDLDFRVAVATSKTSVVVGVPVIWQLGFSVRTAICATSIPRPARRAISSALRFSTLKVPPPTVPSPQMPTLTGFTMNSP